MKRWLSLLGILLCAAFVLLLLGAFTVRQNEIALIIRLGSIQRVVDQPGLHFKLPFVESVESYEKWLLDYDSSPREILTRDKKNLVVDNYVKWRIVDARQFYQAVKSVNGAQSRLDDLVYSLIRQFLGNFTLEEIVKDKRSEILREITKQAAEQARTWGIELIDCRIKRADLPQENEGAVYQRMQTERIRDAKLYRSEGEEAARKTRAEADKQKQIILADADRESQEIRGRADGEAIRIFADAYGQDPDFFLFFRTLEAYRAGLKTGATLVLTPETEILHFLKSSESPAKAGTNQTDASAAPGGPPAAPTQPPDASDRQPDAAGPAPDAPGQRTDAGTGLEPAPERTPPPR